jgi:SsrA-binding protein
MARAFLRRHVTLLRVCEETLAPAPGRWHAHPFMAAKSKVALPKEIRNSKAGRDYSIGERYEAGIVLTGTEVKSIRAGRAQISDSFCKVERGELYAVNLFIEEYAFGNINNHLPRRQRKLLMKSNQIRKLQREIEAAGLSLIPLRLYFKEGLVKIEIALCTGKKLYDKREDLRKDAVMREADRYLKRR